MTRLAGYTTPDPSSGTFAIIDCCSSQIGGFSFEGQTVAFRGASTIRPR